jgi:hypothetical protein
VVVGNEIGAAAQDMEGIGQRKETSGESEEGVQRMGEWGGWDAMCGLVRRCPRKDAYKRCVCISNVTAPHHQAVSPSGA